MKKVFAFIGLVFLVACGNEVGVNQELVLESITKYECDAVTLNKKLIVNYQKFDRNGSVIEVINYDNGKKTSQSTFSYNSNTRTEVISYFNSVNNVDSSFTYYSTFEQEQLKKQIVTNHRGDTLKFYTFEYDTKGNVTSKSLLNSNGSLLKKYIYNNVYSTTDGSLTQRTETVGNSQVTRETFCYNSSSKKIERLSYNSENVLESKITYTVNDANKIVKEEFTNKEGIIRVYIYEYKYF